MGTWTQVGNIKGPAGKSAYQVWLDAGNIGSQQDFLDSLVADSTATSPGIRRINSYSDVRPADRAGDVGIQLDGELLQLQDQIPASYQIAREAMGDPMIIAETSYSLNDVNSPTLESGIETNGVVRELTDTSNHIETYYFTTPGLRVGLRVGSFEDLKSDVAVPFRVRSTPNSSQAIQLPAIFDLGIAVRLRGDLTPLGIDPEITDVTTQIPIAWFDDAQHRNSWNVPGAVGSADKATYDNMPLDSYGFVSLPGRDFLQQAYDTLSEQYGQLSTIGITVDVIPDIYLTIQMPWVGTAAVTLYGRLNTDEPWPRYWVPTGANLFTSAEAPPPTAGAVIEPLESLEPGTPVSLEVTETGTLRAKASVREDSGARLFGPYDLGPNAGLAMREAFTALAGGLVDEDYVSHALSLRAVNGVMEARLAVRLDPVALTSGVPGPTVPYEIQTVMAVLDTGFDFGITRNFPFTLTEPAPGFSATIIFRPTQGESYPPYVEVAIYRQNDADWNDLGGTVNALATFVAPEYVQAELKGQRGYDPIFDGGSPSAPKPTATRIFTANQIPAIAAQPISGKHINIAPIVDGGNLPVGFGDLNDNTGPIRIVGWQLAGGYPVDFGATFETEEIRGFRVLNDGWVWATSADPRGGSDGSTDYLVTNKPIPGPGPIISTWRSITGTDPVGLGHMVHALDVAQHSNDNLYICGGRDFTTEERDEAEAAYPDLGFSTGDNSMACVWRSNDSGVTWTEVVKSFTQLGPNGYQRFYGIGVIGDRLFVPSMVACDSDGTPNPAGLYRGYWQMEPDETWSLKPPLDTSVPDLGLGMTFASDRPFPRDSQKLSWGGAFYDRESNVYRAATYTYTDRLVANTESGGQVHIGRDEVNGVAFEGDGYITQDVEDQKTVLLLNRKKIPIDRINSSVPVTAWSFSTESNGDLLVCDTISVYRVRREDIV